MLMEGTSIGRDEENSLTEAALEDALVAEFDQTEGAILFFASPQNIDRMVSIYRARVARTNFSSMPKSSIGRNDTSPLAGTLSRASLFGGFIWLTSLSILACQPFFIVRP
jgi:hypothetical protein